MADAQWVPAAVLLVAIALVFTVAVVVLVRHHRGPVDEHQAAEDLAEHLAYLRSLPATPSVEQAAVNRANASRRTEVFERVREEESVACQGI